MINANQNLKSVKDRPVYQAPQIKSYSDEEILQSLGPAQTGATGSQIRFFKLPEVSFASAGLGRLSKSESAYHKDQPKANALGWSLWYASLSTHSTFTYKS